MELRGSEIGREGFEPSTLGLREPLRDLGLAPARLGFVGKSRSERSSRLGPSRCNLCCHPKRSTNAKDVLSSDQTDLRTPHRLDATPQPSSREPAAMLVGERARAPRAPGPLASYSRVYRRAGYCVQGPGSSVWASVNCSAPHALVRTTDGGEAHGFRALAFASGSSLRCCCCG